MEALWVPLYSPSTEERGEVLPDFPGRIKAVKINFLLKMEEYIE